MDLTIWTVGHSTRSIEEFVAVLEAAGIKVLADVRRFPGSRRYPHFNKEPLRESLSKKGIEYREMPELGGRRRPQPESTNTAWRNEGFRAYADFMETDAFRTVMGELIDLGRDTNVAVMCAESVWWRCHRSLIADYLKAIGATVLHIFDAEKVEEHPYTSAARLDEGRLTYGGVALTD